ncbi:hypothetical protein AVEN_126201-1 [Araneus ventricosus]|uniref:Uncharacterized protein n=1 Tax=Araneus ventricosus TaxID=182803 RepID=A0A4Y2HWD6_ARAVE|nr:hypothetical protein AVEN_126201-1 [Araneus ventricosus]
MEEKKGVGPFCRKPDLGAGEKQLNSTGDVTSCAGEKQLNSGNTNSPRNQEENNSTLPTISPGILPLTMNNIRTKFYPNCSCSSEYMSLHALLVVS